MKQKIPKDEKVNKNGPGRPKAILDEDKLFQMAAEDCTVREISATLGCHIDTIYARYSDVLRAGRDAGNASLKRKMFEMAMSGNCQMLIWLSKQRLGYKEKQPEEMEQATFNVYVNEVPKKKK